MTDSVNTNFPLVSIVMAAYNEEKHISESITSVLAQTYPHFEFIIVNDGSTDQTDNIIRSFKDPRIHYIINEKNLKLIDSLNKGLQIAKGKYIARMDADDICMPERLEKQVAFMEANPEIGISGAQLQTFGNTRGTMNYPLAHEAIKTGLLLTSCFGNNVVIFRKKIMDEHSLFFPKGYLHAEDYKCWTNWVLVTKAANLDDYLVKYRSHDNSVSIKNRTLQRETRNRIRTEYLATLFNLADKKTAEKFSGAISKNRIGAIEHILELNASRKIFGQEELKKTAITLWYMDSLERIETNFFIFFKFPLIFKLSSGNNFRNWINLLKHYIKSR